MAALLSIYTKSILKKVDALHQNKRVKQSRYRSGVAQRVPGI
jgi:hypothetical protein